MMPFILLLAIFCDSWLTREDCSLGIQAACAKIATTYEAKP